MKDSNRLFRVFERITAESERLYFHHFVDDVRGIDDLIRYADFMEIGLEEYEADLIIKLAKKYLWMSANCDMTPTKYHSQFLCMLDEEKEVDEETKDAVFNYTAKMHEDEFIRIINDYNCKGVTFMGTKVDPNKEMHYDTEGNAFYWGFVYRDAILFGSTIRYETIYKYYIPNEFEFEPNLIHIVDYKEDIGIDHFKYMNKPDFKVYNAPALLPYNKLDVFDVGELICRNVSKENNLMNFDLNQILRSIEISIKH